MRRAGLPWQNQSEMRHQPPHTSMSFLLQRLAGSGRYDWFYWWGRDWSAVDRSPLDMYLGTIAGLLGNRLVCSRMIYREMTTSTASTLHSRSWRWRCQALESTCFAPRTCTLRHLLRFRPRSTSQILHHPTACRQRRVTFGAECLSRGQRWLG